MANKHEFEKSLKRLEEITDKLESGDLALDDSLSLFEEGSGLIKKCNSLLDEAEQKVSLLTRGESGVEEVPFED